MTDKCLFCEIYKNRNGIIYENECFYSRFDLFPVSPGHIEVIPKEHIVSLTDLSYKEELLLLPTIRDTVKIIESTNFKKLYKDFLKNPLNDKAKWFYEQMLNHVGIDKKPDGYNFGINDGEAAGRTIHHLHIHVIPRYKGDVKNPRGGVRNIIPRFGDYK